MLFKSFQEISNKYWKINPFYFYIAFVIAFIVLNSRGQLPNVVSQKGDDITVYLTISAMISSFLGISTALIGSLSIQYSITKILIRYSYLQILISNLLLYLLYFTIPEKSNLITYLIIWSAICMIIHSFMIIDKMFEPEELIVDVVAPMILQFEKSKLKQPNNNDSSIFDFFRKEKIKPLMDNEMLSFIEYKNAELGNFSKIIYRLTKNHSFKLMHFFSYLENNISNKNPPNWYADSVTEGTDCDGYKWFLSAFLIHEITNLAKQSKEYDIIYGQLLFYITVQIVSIKENPEGKYGKLDNIGFGEMFKLLHEKGSNLEIIKSFIAEDDEGKIKDKIHNDTSIQILAFTVSVMADFIETNYKKISSNEKTSERNLNAIIKIGNTIAKQIEKISKLEKFDLNSERDNIKNIIDVFFKLYSEMIVYIFNRKIIFTKKDESDTYVEYLENILNKNWNYTEKIIIDKIENINNMSLADKEYQEGYIQSIRHLAIPDKLSQTSKNLILLKSKFPPSPPTL